MSPIKVNYFDSVKNKRTSTTINRNIALFFCISSRIDFSSCKDYDYLLSRAVQDFINANPNLCKSKSDIEYFLLTEIKRFSFQDGLKQTRLDNLEEACAIMTNTETTKI